MWISSTHILTNTLKQNVKNNMFWLFKKLLIFCNTKLLKTEQVTNDKHKSKINHTSETSELVSN